MGSKEKYVKKKNIKIKKQIKNNQIDKNNNDQIGDEAFSRRGYLKLRYVLKDGLVDNFDDLENIYHHTFYNGNQK